MPDSKPLEKAKLIQLSSDFKTEMPSVKSTTVQFNPESLKVTYANSISQPGGTNDQGGTPTMLYVGAGTMKLTMTLWFDATASVPMGATEDNAQTVDDVTLLTQEVTYFITPIAAGDKFIPPAVIFKWGSFSFSGLMESIDESIEFFSPDGKPLRSSMNLTISQQKIETVRIKPTPGGMPAPPGQSPLASAAANQSLQSMAAAQGLGGNWQGIANANGIQNPRLLAPGTLINLNASLTNG
ncbi:MAG TPA: hypothetical protein VG326_21325 [Tepidisphaeraceae bacterium]|jgi:hypothetical protein|nr:hypothetical protein [Tepidisphaeraceae bacterium]